MVPDTEHDLFGECVRVTVNKTIYSEAAIFKAAYWFTDRYYLFLDLLADGRVVVEIRGKSLLTQDQLKAVANEFCNSLIDFRVREQVMQQTASIRDALILKAFGEGASSLGTSEDKSK